MAKERAKRSTKSQKEFRVATIYGMLCENRSNTEILRFAAEESGWGVCERQVENYIADARELQRKDCEMSREAFMAEALAGYRELKAAASRRGQLMCAKQCLDAMVDLVGLKA